MKRSSLLRKSIWFKIILAILLSTSCKKSLLEEFVPIIELNQKPVVEAHTVSFKAKLTNTGGHRIVGYGFHWKSGNSTIGTYFAEESNFGGSEFSKTIDYALQANSTYSVEAFVVTTNQIIISKSKDFTSMGSLPPVVSNFYPSSGSENDTLTIVGERFPTLKFLYTDNWRNTCKVRFGYSPAILISIDYDEIVLLVPSKSIGLTPGEISLEIPGHKIVVGNFTYLDR